MSQIVVLSLPESPTVSGPHVPPFIDDRRATRYQYATIGRARLKYVIVDIDATGRQEWSEQESGELRWHPFTPTAAESAMIRGWVDSGYRPGGWPLVAVPIHGLP